jgi:hypothetical protein
MKVSLMKYTSSDVLPGVGGAGKVNLKVLPFADFSALTSFSSEVTRGMSPIRWGGNSTVLLVPSATITHQWGLRCCFVVRLVSRKTQRQRCDCIRTHPWPARSVRENNIFVVLVLHLLVLLRSLESLRRGFLGSQMYGVDKLTKGANGDAVFSLD